MLRANKLDCVFLSVSIAVGDFIGFSISPNPVNPTTHNQTSYCCKIIKYNSLMLHKYNTGYDTLYVFYLLVIVWPGTFVPGWRHTFGLGRASTPAPLVYRQIVCCSTHTHNTFGDRSFAVAGPRVWSSLPANLCDEDITYTSFRRELKTYWFSCGRGAMWHSA